MNKNKYNLTKEMLQNLYTDKKMSCKEIAQKLNVGCSGTIMMYLKKYNIPRRTQTELKTIYPKKNFSGNFDEKAYLLGLRTGDIYARKNHQCIRVAVNTTHLSQINMFKSAFGRYSHVSVDVYKKAIFGKDWRLYSDLNSTFSFLLNKPKEIPDEILKNTSAFYSFLTGYMDSEGTWDIRKSNKNNTRISFRIRTSDKQILTQIIEKLKELGYNPTFYLERLKGDKTNLGIFANDFFSLSLLKRDDTLRIANKMLTITKHFEKKRRMKLILENYGEKWDEIEAKVLCLRKEIKSEHINSLVGD